MKRKMVGLVMGLSLCMAASCVVYAEEGAYEPVVIENMGAETEYTAKPESVLALTLNSAEIIAALGEAGSLAGVSNNFNTYEDILPEYYEEIKDVPRPEAINSGIPTLESMLEFAPDLVVANAYYLNAPQFGTIDDYNGNDINFYAPEGTYVAGATIENTYNDILNLGKIFGKAELAEELVKGMQEKIEEISGKIEGKEAMRVMSFDSYTDGSYYIAGGSGLMQNLIELAGGENVFSDVEAQFSAVSLEEIIARNPEMIVISEYSIYENDAQEKIDFLKSQEGMEDIEAVKNDNFVIVSLYTITPSLQNADVVEAMATAMYPDVFTE